MYSEKTKQAYLENKKEFIKRNVETVRRGVEMGKEIMDEEGYDQFVAELKELIGKL
ncbi:hypothetical protein [Enterococcus mundtii]|uniref:hypothetical protein n=1 Tax=Enterococcus mundtii TaxID=53346 RepID=UPI001A9649F7|nr:hypothetical protein [Enterococcus mundtii]